LSQLTVKIRFVPNLVYQGPSVHAAGLSLFCGGGLKSNNQKVRRPIVSSSGKRVSDEPAQKRSHEQFSAREAARKVAVHRL
jgi:hypothetical protein